MLDNSLQLGDCTSSTERTHSPMQQRSMCLRGEIKLLMTRDSVFALGSSGSYPL